LATGVLDDTEIERFLNLAQRLPDLTADELDDLTVVAPRASTTATDLITAPRRGLF